MLVYIKMYVSLLIGFEYINSKEWKSLPGIPVDLYQAYVNSMKISKNIKVFTDLTKDYRTTILQRAIIDGYADSNLLSFIEDIKEKQQYILYQSEKKNNYVVNNFENVITNVLRNDRNKDVTHIFIYFTGHAKNGHIILPDDTHVSLTHLKDLIVSNTNPDCQIVVILDCCQSNGMDLPYIFNGNYKLNNYNFINPSIICFSSSQIDEDSSASRSGSVFTRNIFNVIFGFPSQTSDSQNNINDGGKILPIKSLFHKIKCTIYCSYPENILWAWVSGYNKNNMNITIDNYNSTISVVLNNCHNTINGSASISDYLRYLSELNYKIK